MWNSISFECLKIQILLKSLSFWEICTWINLTRMHCFCLRLMKYLYFLALPLWLLIFYFWLQSYSVRLKFSTNFGGIKTSEFTINKTKIHSVLPQAPKVLSSPISIPNFLEGWTLMQSLTLPKPKISEQTHHTFV